MPLYKNVHIYGRKTSLRTSFKKRSIDVMRVGYGLSTMGLALVILATCSPVLACGGGGSSSYRKPLRPGHEHQSAARQPLPKGMKQTTASSPAQPQAADLSTP